MERIKPVVLEALKQYGCISQMDMAVEEMAELIKAINKIKRTFHPNQIDHFKACTQNGDQMPFLDDEKKALVYHQIISEIADVKIMIFQLEQIFNNEAIAISAERKVARLYENLNK